MSKKNQVNFRLTPELIGLMDQLAVVLTVERKKSSTRTDVIKVAIERLAESYFGQSTEGGADAAEQGGLGLGSGCHRPDLPFVPLGFGPLLE